MIIDQLIDEALLLSRGRKVKDLRAGLGYTAVVLEDNAAGLAYSFRNEMGECCGILDEAGSLEGRDAAELIVWAKEKDILKAAIGLAAINAVINSQASGWLEANVIEAVNVLESETLGMVGEFPPILNKVRKQTDHIYVFEKNLDKGENLYPDTLIPELLPGCDVIVVTATTLINHSIDEVLSYAGNAREIALVGPSTPLSTAIFNKHKITLLAGSIVKDTELLLKIVSQGGGTMSMKPALKHVIMNI